MIEISHSMMKQKNWVLRAIVWLAAESPWSTLMAGEALTDLRQLNVASARIAEFAVKVCHPKVIQYQFVQSGQRKLAQYFSCRLTSATEHDYCEGCVRGSKEQVQSAAESFKLGKWC